MSKTAGSVVPYALAVFVSASLVFTVQPMIAKLVLPLLGGSSSVWNTCIVFFQLALLVVAISAGSIVEAADVGVTICTML